jgi:hypothetical protein
MNETEKKFTIKTDHKWRQFKYRDEVPDKVMRDQFSHLDNMDGFFKYRDWWYHLSDFMLVDEHSPLREHGWHGYHSDSYFSGVVIKTHPDGGEYMVGTYMS